MTVITSYSIHYTKLYDIVTSRQKKDAEAEREDIAPLPTDEAVKLLRAWGGDRAENEEAARQISYNFV